MSSEDEPEVLDHRLMASLARLGPRRAARVKYEVLAIRAHTEPDPRLDELVDNDPGHRWFCYCLDAVARSDTWEDSLLIPRAGQDAGAWDVSVAAHRERLLRARRDDPLAQDRDQADWRDQETADVEVLRGDARD